MYPVRDWNPDHIPITVTGNVASQAIHPRDLTLQHPHDPHVEITTVYLNGLGYPVTVVLRDGVEFTIPTLGGNPAKRQFTVQVRYRFSKRVKVNAQRLLHAAEQGYEAAKVFMDGLRMAESMVNIHGMEIVIRRSVDASTLESSNGSIYLADLDLVLRYVDDDVTVYHPEHPNGRAIIARQRNNNPGFEFKLEINDPHHRFGDRYTVMRGVLIRIKTIQDPSRAEGVYAWMNGVADHDPMTGEYQYYNFEEAEKALRLYDTAAKAKAHGEESEQRREESEQRRIELENEQHQQKLEVLRLEGEIRRMTHDNEVEISKYKQMKVELDAKVTEELARIKRREAELDEAFNKRERERDLAFAEEKVRREIRMMADKEYYERRSYDRKDSSEIVKWIPAAALGLGMILSKFF